MDSRLSFTWFGHATFLLNTPGGRRIMFDPWVLGNPSCPESLKKVTSLDLMLVTHGHDDHTGDALSIGRATDAMVIAPFELATWFQAKGLKNVTGMNHGGAIHALGLTITMVQAFHSSSITDDGRTVSTGEPCGYVLRLEDGLTIYYSGDTALFGDMRLIAELYEPAIAFLPIGDTYTMGPRTAAKACELLGVRQVVPMHYGTFPALTGTPSALRDELKARKLSVEVVELRPGETAQ